MLLTAKVAAAVHRSLYLLSNTITVGFVAATAVIALFCGPRHRAYALAQFARIAPLDPAVAVLAVGLVTLVALPFGAARQRYARRLLNAAFDASAGMQSPMTGGAR